jgi:hypothetical protein
MKNESKKQTENIDNGTEKLLLSDVIASFREASELLNQIILPLGVRDVSMLEECKERDENYEYYKRMIKVSKWLRENSL